MLESPSARGARSEAAILHALVAAGKSVLLPWGAHHRYDFVLDDGGGRFTRLQCKTGIYRNGCIYFRTCSADRRRPLGDSYAGQVDAFAVHCPQLNTSYLVPVQEHIPRERQLALIHPPEPVGLTSARPRYHCM
jgi:hypothetical protein